MSGVYDEALNSIQEAFRSYMYASTVASCVIITYISWSLSRELFPILQSGFICNAVHYLLTAAAAVHVVILYFLTPGHEGVTYWALWCSGMTLAFLSLCYAITYLYTFIKRHFKYGDWRISFASYRFIMVGPQVISVPSFPKILSFAVEKASADGVVVSNFNIDKLRRCNGDVSTKQVIAMMGSCAKEYTLVKSLEVDTYPNVTFHIFLLKQNEFKGFLTLPYDRDVFS